MKQHSVIIDPDALRRDLCALMLAALALVSVAFPASVFAGSIGLEQVRRLIDERGVTSVEQLLAELPDGLRESYVLMFSSRSLQGATYRDPRVIMYSRNGGFVLTFNGSSSERGYAALEMMEFDGHDQRFLFQELTFAVGPDGLLRPEFSEINPAKCSGCHGSPAHPIWDAHPVWPGAYGEVYRTTPSQEESQGLQDFLDHRSQNRRYASLLGLDAFRYRSTFRPVGKERYDGVRVESPNSELTSLLTALNFRAFANEVRKSPDFDAFRYAILGASRGTCGDPAGFFPAGLREAAAASYRDFEAEVGMRETRQRDLKAQRLSPRHGSYQVSRGSSDDYSAQLSLRFLAHVALGMDDQEWALDLEKGSKSFQAPLAAVREFEDSLLKQVSGSDPVVAQLHPYDPQTNNGKYCAYLTEQSQRSLNAALPQLANLTRRLRLSSRETPAGATSR